MDAASARTPAVRGLNGRVCPRCGSRRAWRLQDGRRRCARCRFDWYPGRLPLQLNTTQWRAVLYWFVRGMTSAQIAHETGLERKRVLRALTSVREAIAGRHAPTLAVRSTVPAPAPIIGLSLIDGAAFAAVLAPEEAEGFLAAIGGDGRRQPRLVAWTGALPYAAVVYRGRFYRLAAVAEEAQPRFGPLEAFWAYLRYRLRSRRGIRRERLGLYLAEYAWRYNRRAVPYPEQLRELFARLRRLQSEHRRSSRRARNANAPP
ncbi:MAG: transposase [Acidobacteria bacterium]|nr:transposase [Acidobacteriota bacterium]